LSGSYYTFKNHYPQYFGDLGFEVVHFYDYLEKMIADGALKLANGERLIPITTPAASDAWRRSMIAPVDFEKSG